MINIPRNLIKSVQDGTEKMNTLETYIISNFSIAEIIKSFSELLIEANRQQISVSEEEYQAIMNLFKVRGKRIMEDGTVQDEKRGRPRKED